LAGERERAWNCCPAIDRVHDENAVAGRLRSRSGGVVDEQAGRAGGRAAIDDQPVGRRAIATEISVEQDLAARAGIIHRGQGFVA
jgi:hypothetical protein